MAEDLISRIAATGSMARFGNPGGLVVRSLALPASAVLAYGVAAQLLLGSVVGEVGIETRNILTLVQTVIPLFLVAGALYGTVLLALTDNGERPFRRVLSWIRRTPFAEIAVLRLLRALGLFITFQPLFLAVKQAIPDIMPFTWDPLLARLDRALFLGKDPWVISHALLPSASATKAFDLCYAAWFFVMLVAYVAASVMRLSSTLRLTFLTAFFLNWILAGSVAAILFSSAGPVYMERLFGMADFAPLMERLAAQHETVEIFALNVQDALWRGYADPNYPRTGISAFPSMHLCISMTVTLFCLRLGRGLGILMGIFTGVMLIASVHLGWHYLVDGLAGIGLSIAIWNLSAALSRRWLASWPNGTPDVTESV